MKASLLGFQGQECAAKITSELSIPLTEDEFMQECNKIYKVVFPTVKLMPGTLIYSVDILSSFHCKHTKKAKTFV